MAEGLAERRHLPGPRISRVYGEWAKGGWGALLTGMRILDCSLELVSALKLTI